MIRLVAVVVLLGVLWQASGLASAFENDGIVHCCCGDHDAGHHCDCSDCPGRGELRFLPKRTRTAPEHESRIVSCRGKYQVAPLVQIPALPVRAPLVVAGPDLTRHPLPSLIQPLLDRLVVASRPPP